jgi:hypothetical protein
MSALRRDWLRSFRKIWVIRRLLDGFVTRLPIFDDPDRLSDSGSVIPVSE